MPLIEPAPTAAAARVEKLLKAREMHLTRNEAYYCRLYLHYRAENRPSDAFERWLSDSGLLGFDSSAKKGRTAAPGFSSLGPRSD